MYKYISTDILCESKSESADFSELCLKSLQRRAETDSNHDFSEFGLFQNFCVMALGVVRYACARWCNAENQKKNSPDGFGVVRYACARRCNAGACW